MGIYYETYRFQIHIRVYHSIKRTNIKIFKVSGNCFHHLDYIYSYMKTIENRCFTFQRHIKPKWEEIE